MINPQFDNQAISSFVLWADYILGFKGQAFTNVSSQFYPVQNNYYGYYTYGAPFIPFVADTSVTGANIISGVYLNGNYVTGGQSGFVDINYAKGELYFSSQLPPGTMVSGNYAIKDLVIQLTSDADEKLMFETKYDLRPKTYQVPTGLPPETTTVPIIYIKNDGGVNQLISLDGQENCSLYLRMVVLTDSQYLLDAVGSLFKDRARSKIPLLNLQDMPYNNLGGYLNGVPLNYNYFATGKMIGNNSLFIENVSFSKFTARNVLASELNDLNPSLYFGFLDFDVSFVRMTRT